LELKTIAHKLSFSELISFIRIIKLFVQNSICGVIQLENILKAQNLPSQSIEFFKIDRNYIITCWATNRESHGQDSLGYPQMGHRICL